MKAIVTGLFTFGLIGFIGLLYFLIGGSPHLLGVGFALFSLVFIALFIGASWKILKNSKFSTQLVLLLYLSAIAITLYGLAIRIFEGMGRYQHPVGFNIFFIGLGMLLVLLILQFFYVLFFFKEPENQLGNKKEA